MIVFGRRLKLDCGKTNSNCCYGVIGLVVDLGTVKSDGAYFLRSTNSGQCL